MSDLFVEIVCVLVLPIETLLCLGHHPAGLAKGSGDSVRIADFLGRSFH